MIPCDVVTAHGTFSDGHRTDVSYRGRLRLSPQFAIEPGAAINWIDLPQRSVAARLVSARTTYAFTPGIVALTSAYALETVGPKLHRRAWGLATFSFSIAQAGGGFRRGPRE